MSESLKVTVETTSSQEKDPQSEVSLLRRELERIQTDDDANAFFDRLAGFAGSRKTTDLRSFLRTLFTGPEAGQDSDGDALVERVLGGIGVARKELSERKLPQAEEREKHAQLNRELVYRLKDVLTDTDVRVEGVQGDSTSVSNTKTNNGEGKKAELHRSSSQEKDVAKKVESAPLNSEQIMSSFYTFQELFHTEDGLRRLKQLVDTRMHGLDEVFSLHSLPKNKQKEWAEKHGEVRLEKVRQYHKLISTHLTKHVKHFDRYPAGALDSHMIRPWYRMVDEYLEDVRAISDVLEKDYAYERAYEGAASNTGEDEVSREEASGGTDAVYDAEEDKVQAAEVATSTSSAEDQETKEETSSGLTQETQEVPVTEEGDSATESNEPTHFGFYSANELGTEQNDGNEPRGGRETDTTIPGFGRFTTEELDQLQEVHERTKSMNRAEPTLDASPETRQSPDTDARTESTSENVQKDPESNVDATDPHGDLHAAKSAYENALKDFYQGTRWRRFGGAMRSAWGFADPKVLSSELMALQKTYNERKEEHLATLPESERKVAALRMMIEDARFLVAAQERQLEAETEKQVSRVKAFLSRHKKKVAVVAIGGVATLGVVTGGAAGVAAFAAAASTGYGAGKLTSRVGKMSLAELELKTVNAEKALEKQYDTGRIDELGLVEAYREVARQKLYNKVATRVVGTGAGVLAGSAAYQEGNAVFGGTEQTTVTTEVPDEELQRVIAENNSAEVVIEDRGSMQPESETEVHTLEETDGAPESETVTPEEQAASMDALGLNEELPGESGLPAGERTFVVREGDTLGELLTGEKGPGEMSEPLRDLSVSERQAVLERLYDRIGANDALRQAANITSDSADVIYAGQKIDLAPLDAELNRLITESATVSAEQVVPEPMYSDTFDMDGVETDALVTEDVPQKLNEIPATDELDDASESEAGTKPTQEESGTFFAPTDATEARFGDTGTHGEVPDAESYTKIPTPAERPEFMPEENLNEVPEYSPTDSRMSLESVAPGVENSYGQFFLHGDAPEYVPVMDAKEISSQVNAIVKSVDNTSFLGSIFGHSGAYEAIKGLTFDQFGTMDVESFIANENVDPEAFNRWEATLGQMVEEVGGVYHDETLEGFLLRVVDGRMQGVAASSTA